MATGMSPFHQEKKAFPEEPPSRFLFLVYWSEQTNPAPKETEKINNRITMIGLPQSRSVASGWAHWHFREPGRKRKIDVN